MPNIIKSGDNDKDAIVLMVAPSLCPPVDSVVITVTPVGRVRMHSLNFSIEDIYAGKIRSGSYNNNK